VHAGPPRHRLVARFEIVAYNLLDHPEARGIVVNGREISERQQREVEKDPLMEN